MIDAVASEPHYLAHLAPIWHALPAGERGTVYVAHRLADLAAGEGMGPMVAGWPPPADTVTMVASYNDSVLARSLGRPVVYVEHGAGQCLAPETRVLRSDLRWVPLEDIQVGDQLVAFEENPTDRPWRGWQPATVLAKRIISRPCYRLHFADGTKVVASAEHLWLKRNRERYEWLTTDRLQPESVYPKHASKVLKTMVPWAEDTSWGAGYLAAAFDGEGSLCQTRREARQNRLMLTFTQRQNVMWEMVQRELDRRGINYSTAGRNRADGVRNLTILGGVGGVLSFLGSIRPRRLLGGMQPLVNGQMRGTPVALIDSEFIGEHPVVAIKTTTGTLIAEGFATHNSYDGDERSARHPSYSGGDEHDGTVMFVCPSEVVAARWRSRYPGVPAVAVGCPRLDRWHDGTARRGAGPATVAVSFHADIGLCVETRSAWSHYNAHLAPVVARLRASNVEVLGHAHPRLWSRLAPRWRAVGVEPVEDFAEVLARADCYAADNSSTLPEFASTGRPVVWLNAPWFRRTVDHGGRFWDWPAGQVCCDEPAQLADRVLEALADPDSVAAARAAMVEAVYVACDGHAAERAAAAVLTVAPAAIVGG